MMTTENPRPRSPRDERLDFFRGIAMFIIFIAHMPENPWFGFIPARFGFSSAAEIFVFCSGFASSLAFGQVFIRSDFWQGMWDGTKSILFRLWEVYWAHIGLTLALITVSIAAMEVTMIDYPAQLGLSWFFAHPAEGFLKMMSLRLMPNFLDILPMYLVILGMIPLVMVLAHLSRFLSMGLLVLLWGYVQFYGLNLPGGAEPGMVWYLNPFAWQLVFFTGFAFGMGWIKPPPLRRGRLFYLCLTFLILSIPVNFWGLTANFPALEAAHDWLLPHGSKTNFHALLYLHFLACAYVALVLVEPYRAQLNRFWPIILVGQHALATFMSSILLASLGGIMLDALGRDFVTVALINIAGIVGLVSVAKLARSYRDRKLRKHPLKAAGLAHSLARVDTQLPSAHFGELKN